MYNLAKLIQNQEYYLIPRPYYTLYLEHGVRAGPDLEKSGNNGVNLEK